MSIHDYYMSRALTLARRAVGSTTPNPAVGAVLVRDGKICGEGWHQRAGEAHAEVLALQAAGSSARGADLYVTLEPCNHHGQTPPCSEAVIEAGVKRVFVAMNDPNPHVCGQGIERLREAGLEVFEGIYQQSAERLLRPWTFWLETAMPYASGVLTLSLDGRHTKIESTIVSAPTWARYRREYSRFEALVDVLPVECRTRLKELACVWRFHRRRKVFFVEDLMSLAEICKGEEECQAFLSNSEIVCTARTEAAAVEVVKSYGAVVTISAERSFAEVVEETLRGMGKGGVQSLHAASTPMTMLLLRLGLLQQLVVCRSPGFEGSEGEPLVNELQMSLVATSRSSEEALSVYELPA